MDRWWRGRAWGRALPVWIAASFVAVALPLITASGISAQSAPSGQFPTASPTSSAAPRPQVDRLDPQRTDVGNSLPVSRSAAVPDTGTDPSEAARAWSSGALATATPAAKVPASSGDRLVNADTEVSAIKSDTAVVQASELAGAAPAKAADVNGATFDASSASTASPFESRRLPDVPPDRPVRASSTLPARVIVGFRPGIVRASGVGGVHARAGASVVDVIPQLNADIVQFSDRATAQAKLTLYRAESAVAFAEIDELAYASEVPNDPRYADQWGYAKVFAPDAWSVTHGSSNVKVAVLDTGIFAGHPDLQGKVVASSNFTTAPDVSDRQGHGTHVAGTIAASTNNGVGVAGMGYATSLIIGKVLGDDGSGYTSWSASGIYWAADQGAKVISMSLGSTTSCSVTYQAAIDYAWARGAVVVAAAGNDGTLGTDSPASCNHVVSVAASTTSDALAYFSNYGPTITVAAPGDSILSTTNDGSYGYKSGTSMATPHVAGLLALIWATGWGTGAQAVVDRLTQTADAVSGTGSTTKYGRINASRAVGGSPPTYVAPPLSNDYVTSPTIVNALPFIGQQSTVNATTYTGEPNCSYGWYGATVWYQFTAPVSGSITVDTIGSNFDTVVGIYDYWLTTPALACNDEAYDIVGPSRATATVVAGATYLVQVGGYHAANGNLAIRIGYSYSNNVFSNAYIVSPPLTHDFDTTLATLTSGEPRPCASIGATSWYRYDAPSSQPLLMSTAGSSFDTALAVYVSSAGPTTSFTPLTSIGCIDDSGGSPQARAILYPVAGVTYYIQVGGYSGAAGRLHLSFESIVVASNDNVASAWPVTSDPAVWNVSTFGARTEVGEPQPCGQIGSTVWYRWVPSRTGVATVSTSGSNFDTVLAIYAGPSSGASFPSLVLLECNDDVAGSTNSYSQVSGGVIAGATYYLQLGGYSGYSGSSSIAFSVTVAATPTPTPTATATSTATATATPSATRTLAITAGWNLISLSISPATPMSAASICTGANIVTSGSVAEVVRYTAGGWETHPCSITGSDFPITLGTGYFIRAVNPTSFGYRGTELGQPPTITLTSGWNLVGLPRTTGTASGVAQAINSAASVSGATKEIQRWAAGGWDGHVPGIPVNAFPIESDRGYAIRIDRAATWQPSTTVSSLELRGTSTGTATVIRSAPTAPAEAVTITATATAHATSTHGLNSVAPAPSSMVASATTTLTPFPTP